MNRKTKSSDPLERLIDRIRSEYRELPGLRLTFEQMLRLWTLDRRTCRLVLTRLLDARFLKATSDGQYVRCDVRETLPDGVHVQHDGSADEASQSYRNATG